MAKKGSINVSGLSINDIMNMDLNTFNKLGESDLRRITSRLVSAGNKRIRRLETKGIITPAYRGLGSNTRLSTKLPKGVDKTQRVNALRQEFSRARSFLSAKTSTIGGYKQFTEQVKTDLADSLGVKKSSLKSINISKGYEIFHKLQESGQISGKGSKGSIQMRNYIMNQMLENPDISDSALMQRAIDYDNELYEEEETEESEW